MVPDLLETINWPTPAFFRLIEDRRAWVVVAIGVIVFLATSTRKGDRCCPRCRERTRPQARYCGQCGQLLSNP